MTELDLSNPKPSREARQWAMFCHFAAFLGMWFPFGNLIGPLIIWQLKRESDPFIDEQGKEALNFQITVAIASAICYVLMFVLIGFVLLGLLPWLFMQAWGLYRSLASPHGVRRLISPADNPGGVTVSNCCGTIASVGLHRRASAECRRHDWSSLPSMYRISAHNGLRIRFFIRSSLIVLRVVFLVKLNRIMSITIMQPDKRSSCVTGMNRSRRRRADQRSMAAIWTG